MCRPRWIARATYVRRRKCGTIRNTPPPPLPLRAAAAARNAAAARTRPDRQRATPQQRARVGNVHCVLGMASAAAMRLALRRRSQRRSADRALASLNKSCRLLLRLVLLAAQGGVAGGSTRHSAGEEEKIARGRLRAAEKRLAAALRARRIAVVDRRLPALRATTRSDAGERARARESEREGVSARQRRRRDGTHVAAQLLTHRLRRSARSSSASRLS